VEVPAFMQGRAFKPCKNSHGKDFCALALAPRNCPGLKPKDACGAFFATLKCCRRMNAAASTQTSETRARARVGPQSKAYELHFGIIHRRAIRNPARRLAHSTSSYGHHPGASL
jgi:hypothetical protein